MRKIILHTDGSCSGNPGIGGYGAILCCGKQERIVKGHTTKTTTNNRMELQPIVDALNWLNKVQKEPCEIEVHTDSIYIINCTRTEFKNGDKKTAEWFKGRKNEDLWMELISAGNKGKHKLTFVKVKGHADDEYNERCDKIAKEECAKARHELLKGA